MSIQIALYCVLQNLEGVKRLPGVKKVVTVVCSSCYLVKMGWNSESPANYEIKFSEIQK